MQLRVLVPLFLSLLMLSACARSTESLQQVEPAANSTSAITTPWVRSAVPDGINKKFLDPDLKAEEWLVRWEVESREIFSERLSIVEGVGLAPGATIADVGTGTGLFVEHFSKAVGPNGKVFALDISPKFIDHLRLRVRQEGLGNVEPYLSGETSTELPNDSCDFVFVCDTYHHFEYHEAMLQSIYDSLKPGGILVIIDFERIEGVTREWILGHVRAGKKQVTQEILAAHFELVEEVHIPGLQENYFLRFRKR